jgi:hypothetical protein
MKANHQTGQARDRFAALTTTPTLRFLRDNAATQSRTSEMTVTRPDFLGVRYRIAVHAAAGHGSYCTETL